MNVLYSLEPGGKRAVGFKLSMGMDVSPELADKFKFVRQKSKLAVEIRDFLPCFERKQWAAQP